MARSSFRLKTLLQMREQRRDHHRARLAQALRDDEAIAQCQADLDRQRRELCARSRASAGPGELDMERLTEYSRHDQLLAVEREQLEAQRQQAARRIDRRRAALLAADREVRVIEKLEQRQSQRLAEQEKRYEIMTLDEVASRRG